jgi:FkbM family methyltransferase
MKPAQILCHRLSTHLRRLTEPLVYTMRSGVAKGLKRRGGFGFLGGELAADEEFLAALDLRNKTVFDIGGYEGIYTLFFARAVGPKGRVITFEPNPINCARIRENVALNGFENVTLKPIGLADRPGRAALSFPVGELARGTLQADYQKSLADTFTVRTVDVNLDTLDNQLADLPPPDFIKIDVEGLEVEVLSGMRRLLTEFQPALFLEVHSGVDVKRLTNILADASYAMRDLENDRIVTPENPMGSETGHLYCARTAGTLAPKQHASTLKAA